MDCSVPLRHFVDKEDFVELVKTCTAIRSSWVWGFAAAITVGLFLVRRSFLQDLAAEEPPPPETPPVWVCLFPLIIAAVYTIFSTYSAERNALAEKLRKETSKQETKEYILQRAQDDRTSLATILSLTSPFILASVALFGPFLRADR